MDICIIGVRRNDQSGDGQHHHHAGHADQQCNGRAARNGQSYPGLVAGSNGVAHAGCERCADTDQEHVGCIPHIEGNLVRGHGGVAQCGDQQGNGRERSHFQEITQAHGQPETADLPQCLKMGCDQPQRLR